MTAKQDSHQPTSQKAQYVKPQIALLGEMRETERKTNKATAGTENNFNHRSPS